MKNILIINIDTEREVPITFSKPSEIPQPETKDDAGKMVLFDIICLTESLKTLIVLSSNNGYGDKTELINTAIKTLYETLN